MIQVRQQAERRRRQQGRLKDVEQEEMEITYPEASTQTAEPDPPIVETPREDEWNVPIQPVQEISELDEYITKALEDKEYLITQHYVDPESKQLYEVMDIYVDRRKNSLHSLARPIDHHEDMTYDSTKVQRRPLENTEGTGTIRLISALAREEGTDAAKTWHAPTSDEWMQVLEQDEYCRAIMEKINGKDVVIFENETDKKAKRDAFLFRAEREDDSLGPIQRRFWEEESFEHVNKQYHARILRTQYVVPAQLQQECIRIHHDQLGHPGNSKTLQAISSDFYWPNMKATIRTYCKACHFCRRRKAEYRKGTLPIMQYNRASRPFSRVHIDLAGPLKQSTNGYKYVMLVKCAMTKWIELIPLQDKSQVEVTAGMFNNVYQRHGIPQEIITDRGREFDNALQRQLIDLVGKPAYIHTTPGNPRSNGLAENQVRTMKDMLSSFVNEFQDDWDHYLPVVANCYNSTVNDATGFTPFFLLHGREASMPDEDYIRARQSVNEYAATLRKALLLTWEANSERVLRNTAVFNRRPVRPLKFRPFRVGEYFMLRRVPHRFYRSKKHEEKVKISQALQCRYTGPYMVTEVISPVLYGTTIHGRRLRVHAGKMKHV